jgi:hypothetical protein
MNTSSTMMASAVGTEGSMDVQHELERGIAAAQSGDKATANKQFQALAARAADVPEVWVWLGGTSATLDEAEAAFERAYMLDPGNEEAQLGLRWVALRRQAISRGDTLATNPDLSTGAITTSVASTQGVPTGAMPSAPLQATDADKSVKMKVSRTSSRSRRILIAAVILIIVAAALYGLAIWMAMNGQPNL